MTDVVVPKMGGVKRDSNGKEKRQEKGGPASRDVPPSKYSAMFEGFRDELDEHQDRRMKIIKVSRDVTALSKKVIFSLQRVRRLQQPIPHKIQQEIDERFKEIAPLLASIEDDVKGMNRYRYNLSCLEEYVEAVSFLHYLRHQTLITAEQTAESVPAGISISPADYVFGVFDLTGEMMRFGTSVTALTGSIPGSSAAAAPSDGADVSERQEQEQRTILTDLQDVSSLLMICPPVGGKPGIYSKKLSVMQEQVRKVEKLGYSVTVRGNERPKGWMPDLSEPAGGGGGGGGDDDVTMD